MEGEGLTKDSHSQREEAVFECGGWEAVLRGTTVDKVFTLVSMRNVQSEGTTPHVEGTVTLSIRAQDTTGSHQHTGHNNHTNGSLEREVYCLKYADHIPL